MAPVPIQSCVGGIANRGQWEQGCSLFMAADLGPVRATRRKKRTLHISPEHYKISTTIIQMQLSLIRCSDSGTIMLYARGSQTPGPVPVPGLEDGPSGTRKVAKVVFHLALMPHGTNIVY